MQFRADGHLEDVYWGYSSGQYKVIEVEDWVSEGKYDISSVIFEFDGKCYCLPRMRTGSYYTDYHHDANDWDIEVECLEVEKVAVTKYVWKEKK